MATYIPINNLEQPLNELGQVGETQRKNSIKINDYKQSANEYTSTNKDALSDGDLFGKGTGVFLDPSENGGSSRDISERKEQIKINEYQKNKPYTTPSV
jgi:hypothetical protein